MSSSELPPAPATLPSLMFSGGVLVAAVFVLAIVFCANGARTPGEKVLYGVSILAITVGVGYFLRALDWRRRYINELYLDILGLLEGLESPGSPRKSRSFRLWRTYIPPGKNLPDKLRLKEIERDLIRVGASREARILREAFRHIEGGS